MEDLRRLRTCCGAAVPARTRRDPACRPACEEWAWTWFVFALWRRPWTAQPRAESPSLRLRRSLCRCVSCVPCYNGAGNSCYNGAARLGCGWNVEALFDLEHAALDGR